MALVALYPFVGFTYLLSRPQHLKAVFKTVAVSWLLALVLVGLLLKFTFGPQYTFLIKVFGDNWFCGFVTVLLVIGEAWAPVALLTYKRNKKLRKKLFKDVLAENNVVPAKVTEQELASINAQVLKNHPVTGAAGKDGAAAPVKSRGMDAIPDVLIQIIFWPKPEEGHVIKFIRSAFQTFMMLITGPVGFVILAPSFAYVNAFQNAIKLHSDWFKSKGVETGNQQQVVADRRALEYRTFGLVAGLLEMLPIVCLFLEFSNSIGAALWAIRLEALAKGKKAQ